MKKKQIYKKLQKKNFFPSHVAEVGVFHPEKSNIYDYIKEGVRATLVEPDPESIRKIKEHFSDCNNLTLHPVAIFDYQGELTLIKNKASSYVKNISKSPAVINDNYKISAEDELIVKCTTFDQVDDGSIDLLSIDVEGSEWFVIQSMVSRPKVISLETHGSAYVNPYIDKILGWMKSNEYKLWYKTKADSIYVKENSIPISMIDSINLTGLNTYIFVKKLKQNLKKSVGL